MNFYSCSHEDYITAVKKYNLHPDLIIPNNLTFREIPHMIFYGAPGVGKYSQVLYFLQKYSPRKLAGTKHLTAQFNRQIYKYEISDIHYEIDMGILGCNSKLLWHEIFTQIVDIVSVKPEKMGIIVCKNFHLIHTELLEIFYSYMEHYSSQIRFIFITENVSFIPNSIYERCFIVRVPRPSAAAYEKLLELQNSSIRGIETRDIQNIKEYLSYAEYVENEYASPAVKSFDVICSEIIRQIKDHKKLSFVAFRDAIYDIFIYNLDIPDCIWYICTHFLKDIPEMSEVLLKTYPFFKYFNNNYRPIYHLESLFINIIRVYSAAREGSTAAAGVPTTSPIVVGGRGRGRGGRGGRGGRAAAAAAK